MSGGEQIFQHIYYLVAQMQFTRPDGLTLSVTSNKHFFLDN